MFDDEFWARRELRLDAREARAQVRAGRTLRRLPEVREASRTGSTRLANVKEFTAGVDHYREHRARIRRHLARLRDSARPTRSEVDARRQTYASRLEGHLLHLIRRPDLRLRT